VSVLVRGAEVAGRRTDVRFDQGLVVSLGVLAPTPGEEVVEARGGALIPGLHDHHLHLLATAAARASVDVSDGLAALRGQPGQGWLRAVGWDTGGDRHDVDAVVADRPVRVQHRGGSLWVLNSAALRALDLGGTAVEGLERDVRGMPTGRLWRLDGWLAGRLGTDLPDLGAVTQELAQLGVTGVTDATPDLPEDTCRLLRSAVPQRLLLLGDASGTGPVKVVLSDHDLPTYDALVGRLTALRPRAVAVHCITREALALLLAALDEVGRVPGDRIEHGALLPPDAAALLGVPVVTQPGFLTVRGDDFLRDVPVSDHADLYRYGSLLAGGGCVVPSSDAPHGPLDPWLVLRAARDRVTESGAVVSRSERVTVSVALDGMFRRLEDLSGPARRVALGTTADLVLLHTPLAEALASPTRELVRATWVGGLQLR
jgi:predicted amidohydrolase YtcJ